MTRVKSDPRPEPSNLYPDDKELARVLLGDRADRWPEIAKVEEGHGFPRVDPVYGGRYWPAVKAFYDRRFRLIVEQSYQQEHKPKENFDAIKPRRSRP